MWEKIGKLFRHNLFLCLALGTACLIVLWAYGCESKVRSLDGDGRLITRTELETQLVFLQRKVETYAENLLSTAELRFEQLNRQDLIKRKLFEELLIVAQSGTINPYGVVSAIAGILGIGAVVDNRRKDKVIKTITSNKHNGPSP